jgi:hypothetical protein
MVYQKHIIWTQKDKIMKYTAFVKNKMKIKQNSMKSSWVDNQLQENSANIILTLFCHN